MFNSRGIQQEENVEMPTATEFVAVKALMANKSQGKQHSPRREERPMQTNYVSKIKISKNIEHAWAKFRCSNL